MKQIIVYSLFLVACGTSQTYSPTPTAKNLDTEKKIADLQKQVDNLSLIANAFTAGIDNPFSDCDTVTNAMEQKICQIAQTFTSTQQLETRSQLGIMGKQFQTTLFGVDCINATDIGCPVTGSVTARLSAAETALANNTANITSINSTLTTINTSITALQNRVTALEGRMNNFNGSGQTAEVFIAAIKTDVTTLQSQVADIQGTLSSSRLRYSFDLCGNDSSVGPTYEPILITGDKVKAYGYVKTGTAQGEGSFFKAGDADALFTTHISSRTCNFKMYNNAGKTKIQACWINGNRSATSAQIDAARTALTATCTSF